MPIRIPEPSTTPNGFRRSQMWPADCCRVKTPSGERYTWFSVELVRSNWKGGEVGDRFGIRLGDGDQGGGQAAATKSRYAGGQVVHHAAQAEQIAALIQFASHRLFGSHVTRRSHYRSAVCQPRIVAATSHQAEVADLGPTGCFV